MTRVRFAADPKWVVWESDDGRRLTIDCDGGPMLPRKTIATVYNGRRVDGKANARLMAASPELRAALVRAVGGEDCVDLATVGRVCSERREEPDPRNWCWVCFAHHVLKSAEEKQS